MKRQPIPASPKAQPTESIPQTLLQEIDDAVRLERMTAIWHAYGLYIIVSVVSILLSVAGVKAWQAYEEHQNRTLTSELLEIFDIVDPAERGQALAVIAEKHNDHQFVALLAANNAQETATRLALYRQIADGDASLLRDFAALMAARIGSDMTERKKYLEALVADTTGSLFAEASLDYAALLQQGGQSQNAINVLERLLATETVSANIKENALILKTYIADQQEKENGKK